MKKFILVISMSVCTDLYAQCDYNPASTPESPQLTSAPTNPSTDNLSSQMAQVTSQASLSTYMKIKPATKDPLMLLSKDARTRFLDSLTFK
jgi:hypothetical protein